MTAFETPEPLRFAPYPSTATKSERIVQLALQHQAEVIFAKSPPALLLPKFLAAKLDPFSPPDTPSLRA